MRCVAILEGVFACVFVCAMLCSSESSACMVRYHSQPGYTRIATGEMGVRPRIMVWDVTTMECVFSTR